MGVKRCAYPRCRSDSRYAQKDYMLGVKFLPFPKPISKPLSCKKWLAWLKQVREDFDVLKITENTYICSKHFVDGKGPTALHPDPTHDQFLLQQVDFKPQAASISVQRPVIRPKKPMITPITKETSVSLVSILRPVSKSVQRPVIRPKKPMITPTTKETSVSLVSILRPVSKTVFKDDKELNFEPTPSFTLRETDISNDDLRSDTSLSTKHPGNLEAQDRPTGMEAVVENATKESDPLPLLSSTRIEQDLSNDDLRSDNSLSTEPPGNVENQESPTSTEALAENETKEAEMMNFRSLSGTFNDFFKTKEWCHFERIGWFRCLTNERLELHTISDKTSSILIRIIVKPDFTYSVSVLNQLIENHNLITLPRSITDNITLISVLNTLKTFNVCEGNAEDEVVSLLRERERGFFSWSTGAQHDEKCTRLTNKKICIACSQLRSYALQAISRRKINKTLKYKNHSKEVLIEMLRKSKGNEKNISKKLRRAQLKVKNFIKKQGEYVIGEDHESLKQILTKAVSQGEGENDFVSLFLKTQLKMCKQNNVHGRRWHPLIIQWCLYQYHKSPAAYRSLADSKILKLPSYSTLFRNSWHDGKSIGFNDKMLNRMKDEIKPETLEPWQQYFTILIDEIKAKEDLIYKKVTGDVVGYTKLNDARNKINGLDNDIYSEKPVATHILQLMLRGTTTHTNYPFAHFATSSLTGDDLNSIIWEAVEKLEALGFKIISIVGDGAATNRKFFSMNSVEGSAHYCMNPYSSDEERPIFLIFDPPHLMKTARNCLYNSDIYCHIRLMYKNGQHLTWKPIRDLYLHERHSPGNFRKAHKLSSDNVNLNSYSKMKVAYACQILSQTVANALKQYYGEEHSELVKFLEMFDKWFDILNTTNAQEAYHKRKPNKRPFKSMNDQRLKWLQEEFLGYLADWEKDVKCRTGKFTDEERKKMLLSQETLSGLKQTTRAMVGVTEFLLQKGSSFVLTGKFNQDPLELEFSRHRQACGSNDNPTVDTYTNNGEKLKILKTFKIKTASALGNVTLTSEME